MPSSGNLMEMISYAAGTLFAPLELHAPSFMGTQHYSAQVLDNLQQFRIRE